MAQFQSTVNIYNAIGLPGEIAFSGPMRASPYDLSSAGVPNVIGYAYTATSGASPTPVGGSPNAGTAKVGGTGVFAGILISPKEYASFGTTAGGPLAASIVLPDNAIGYMLTMGYVYANIPGPANVGDLVTYDPLTGALNSIVPTTTFTGTISTTTLTVTAVAAGELAVGQTISGPGVTPGTIITALGTGKGNTGTYTINNSQTVGSATVMTTTNVPAPAFSVTATITTSTGVDTLNVASVGSGSLAVGQQVFGVGVLPNTVITALGSGVGGAGTYTLNTSGQTVGSETMTGPANVLVPNCVIDRFTTNTAGGVAVLKLTN